jgi:hypothetical protein
MMSAAEAPEVSKTAKEARIVEAELSGRRWDVELENHRGTSSMQYAILHHPGLHHLL